MSCSKQNCAQACAVLGAESDSMRHPVVDAHVDVGAVIAKIDIVGHIGGIRNDTNIRFYLVMFITVSNDVFL
jgi:hypothetical protein